MASYERRGDTGLVKLSERNLLALLAKLRDPDSQRTIAKMNDDFSLELVVLAEPDDVHYGARDYPPGKILPKTEEEMERIKGCIT